MSQPNQFGPPQQQRDSGGGHIVLIVLLSIGLASLLCCGGICGGVSFLYYRTPKALAKVKAAIDEQMPAPLIAPRWENDWVAMELLARAYTASLDTVAADKEVIERLGRPIEPTGESDQLFRRERKGGVSMEDEKIEYDIVGPKGKATVRVVSNAGGGPPLSPYSPQGFQPTRINVVLEDGTELEVKPLDPKDDPEP